MSDPSLPLRTAEVKYNFGNVSFTLGPGMFGGKWILSISFLCSSDRAYHKKVYVLDWCIQNSMLCNDKVNDHNDSPEHF